MVKALIVHGMKTILRRAALQRNETHLASTLDSLQGYRTGAPRRGIWPELDISYVQTLKITSSVPRTRVRRSSSHKLQLALGDPVPDHCAHTFAIVSPSSSLPTAPLAVPLSFPLQKGTSEAKRDDRPLPPSPSATTNAPASAPSSA
jgi:hypothetical protein